MANVVAGQFILAKWAGTNNEYVIIHDVSVPNGITFATGTGGTGSIGASVGAVATINTWYHLACWYDSSDQKCRMRVNDAITYVSPTSGALNASTTAAFALGSASDGSGGMVGGQIDEVGFWKRKLNAAEITQLYNGGAGWAFSNFTA